MSFEFTPTETGLRIHDTIENVVLSVDTATAVDPSDAPTAPFRAPLDAAVAVTTPGITFPQLTPVLVRDADGALVGEPDLDATSSFDAGTYELELDVGFKLYVQVTASALQVTRTRDQTRVVFGAPTQTTFGARSFHARPEGVVATTRDPRDLMRAVSTFGSALKTHSPERSFPTLRGHPPELAVRGQTNVPDHLSPPDTDVRIEVPPEYGAIFTVTPLAYYLGATVEPGVDPRLVAGDAVYEFDPDDLPGDVFRVLRHCFLLDCVVRTEGLYSVSLHERDAVTSRVDVDPAALYGRSLADRTAAYLEVPQAEIGDVHRWRNVTDVDPVPLNAEALPYVAYRLSPVRSPAQGNRTVSSDAPNSRRPTEAGDPGDRFPRSVAPGNGRDDGVDVIDPAPFPARHHTWVGDGVPRGGTKPTLGSYLRSVDATPHDDDVDVHVVFVDDEVDQAPVLANYSRFDHREFTVTTHDRPTVSDLRDVLTADHDFVHVVGDVAAGGIPAVDGCLDVRTLPATDVSAFSLSGRYAAKNALSLVRVGALGGIATLEDTDAPQTARDGGTLAALLDDGFSLSAAVDLLDATSPHEYTVVGDGDFRVASTNGYPTYLVAKDTAPGPAVDLHYVCASFPAGALIDTTWFPDDDYRIPGTHTVRYTSDTISLLLENDFPLVVDDTLHWTSDLTEAEFWALVD